MAPYTALLLLHCYALLGACSESGFVPARASISSYEEPSTNIARTSMQGAPSFTMASTEDATSHGSAQDTVNPSPPPQPTGPSPTSPFSNTITPPIECPGVYYTQAGVCCAGSTFLGCSWSDVADGEADPRSCCPTDQFVYALPLTPDQISAAEANGTYSGCPGTMQGGLCCSGPVVYWQNGQQICSFGTAVFSVSTAEDGEPVTSSIQSGSAPTTTMGSGEAPPSGATAGSTGDSSASKASATGSAASAASSAGALRLTPKLDHGLPNLVAIALGVLL